MTSPPSSNSPASASATDSRSDHRSRAATRRTPSSSTRPSRRPGHRGRFDPNWDGTSLLSAVAVFVVGSFSGVVVRTFAGVAAVLALLLCYPASQHRNSVSSTTCAGTTTTVTNSCSSRASCSVSTPRERGGAGATGEVASPVAPSIRPIRCVPRTVEGSAAVSRTTGCFSRRHRRGPTVRPGRRRRRGRHRRGRAPCL